VPQAAEPEVSAAEELTILYQDEWLVAIDKPAGLLVHRSMIDRHETRFAMQMLRDQLGRHVWPLHRLDKPTSGVLLFALSQEVARQMGEHIASRETVKQYLAIVRGYTDEQGLIDYPLKEELDKISDRQADSQKPAQEAITAYERLATVELPYAVGRYATARYSLLAITPETGRKHQIRRHMKHIFHPIVGDTTHGDGRHNQLFRDRFDCRRLLLMASSLQFTHPVSGKTIVIEAAPDAPFLRAIGLFGEPELAQMMAGL
jgi:tRNA pseudouridine65 synthase